MNTPLLTVNNLSVSMSSETIVERVSFTLQEGKSLGIVGESGSGKSLTCRAIMGLLAPNLQASGSVAYQCQELLSVSNQDWRSIRGQKIGMILQNPMTAFNELYKVKSLFVETLKQSPHLSNSDYPRIIREKLEAVNIDYDYVINRYPHELSGGMLQRIAIAITLSLDPKLLIADEPTTAIDSINAYRIIQELSKIQSYSDLSLIVISHDLGMVRHLVDDVLIMRQGQMIEYGSTDQIFDHPQKPYTQELVRINQQLAQGLEEAIQ